MKPKKNHMEQKKNHSNINYWIGVLLAVIVFGIISQVIIGALTQQTRCLESIAEKYPGIECGSSNVIYCDWQNKTYNVVMYQEESEVWCDITDYREPDEQYITELWKPIGAVIVLTIVIGLIGLYSPDKPKGRN